MVFAFRSSFFFLLAIACSFVSTHFAAGIRDNEDRRRCEEFELATATFSDGVADGLSEILQELSVSDNEVVIWKSEDVDIYGNFTERPIAIYTTTNNMTAPTANNVVDDSRSCNSVSGELSFIPLDFNGDRREAQDAIIFAGNTCWDAAEGDRPIKFADGATPAPPPFGGRKLIITGGRGKYECASGGFMIHAQPISFPRNSETVLRYKVAVCYGCNGNKEPRLIDPAEGGIGILTTYVESSGPDAGNTRETAVVLPKGTTQVQGSVTEASDNEDLYQFTVAQAGFYNISSVFPEGDSTLMLFNADGQGLAGNDDATTAAFDSGISIDLTPGTYYFAVSSYPGAAAYVNQADANAHINQFLTRASGTLDTPTTEALGLIAPIEPGDLPSANYIVTISGIPYPCAGLTGAFVCGGDCAPWDENQGPLYMNPAFGAANWKQFTISGAFPMQADLTSFDLIYAEGSEFTYEELLDWLNAGGRETLQALSASGTKVFINAAPAYPSDGVDGDLLYGTTLNINIIAGEVNVVSTDLVNGPYQPTAVALTGGLYSHAKITGGNITTLIEATPGFGGHPVLVQVNGLAVIEGGITNAFFHLPTTEAFNVRANILGYLCSIDKCKPCKDNKDSMVSMTTTFFGECKEKCVPSKFVPTFNKLGYECGFCD